MWIHGRINMTHHRQVETTLRISNDGYIVSAWFTNPKTGALVLVHLGDDHPTNVGLSSQ